jgi:hypothetical protein
MKIKFENTDTFSGEANYCWVNRTVIDCADTTSDLALVRRAKAWAGYSGIPCRREDYGDTIALYPRGICQVLFITSVQP